jgi:hypothetical protein
MNPEEQPSQLEKLYLGNFEIEISSDNTPIMVLRKTSTDEIQNSFNLESLRNRSSIVHPHLLALKRFSVNQEKVIFQAKESKLTKRPYVGPCTKSNWNMSISTGISGRRSTCEITPIAVI